MIVLYLLWAFLIIFVCPSVGFAGGVWVLWNGNFVTVEVLAFSRQSVHALVRFNNDGEWLLLAAYASPNPLIRSDLWKTLSVMSHHVNIPWLVAGDLNDTATSSEKMGGDAFDYRRAALFNPRINDCNLIDLGFKGQPFTWRGKCRGSCIVQERLDRALSSDS